MSLPNSFFRGAALLLVLAASVVAACAPVGETRPAGNSTRRADAGHGELPVWRLDELARSGQPIVALRGPSGAAMPFRAARAALIVAVAEKVTAAAGLNEAPDWLLVATPAINAFAAYQNGRPVIAVTLGMAHVLGDDEGAWGALIGHELAHFRLGHHEAQRSRKQAVQLGSSLAGLALSLFGVGFGNVAADAAGSLVTRSFSRDDERDADREGLAYLRRAGLDPQGAIRLQQKLLEVTRDSSFGFLDTHPSGQDRIERIRTLLEQPDTHDETTSR